MGMGVVVLETEVFVAEIEERLDRRIEGHAWSFSGFSLELRTRLFQMVDVKVGVSEDMNKVPRLQVACLGHHHRQQGIGSDIKRDAQEIVGTALVELTRQPVFRDVELKEHVARWQLHLRDVGDVPGAHHQSPGIGLVSDHLCHLTDLINRLTGRSGPGAPLVSVHGTQFAFFVRPFVPDADAVLLEVSDIGIAP